MNTKLDRTDAITLALLGFSAAVTAAVYGRLPERVPVHFNIHGQADGWMSKPIGAWLLVVVTLLTWIVVRFGAYLLPRAGRARMLASPVKLVALLTVGFLAGLQLLMMFAALESRPSIGRPFAILFGLFWIVLAQVLPRVRRNPFIGIRTAWTLASDENWARTHRFGAWSFTVGGVAALVAAVVAMPTVAIAAIVASGLAPVVWSLIVAHQIPPEV